MNTSSKKLLLSGLSVAFLCIACGDSSPYQGTGNLSGNQTGTDSEQQSGNGTLACLQKSEDGSDSDCVKLGKLRKLDCSTAKEAAAAKAAGCVAEDPDDVTDYDVCCPTTVTGTKPTTLSCRQKAGADGDKECATFSGKPKKLDCDTEENVGSAIDAGCVRQKSGSTDVCCPSTVNGTPA
jgi:hypothetical protein